MERLDTSINSFKTKISKLSTAVIWDRCYSNGFIVKDKLINYSSNKIVSGPVFIVNCHNNILPIIQGLNEIEKGYLLVVNDLSNVEEALLGDIIMTAAYKQQLSGIVVFGCIRDVTSIKKIGLPVWARSATVKPAPLGEPISNFRQSTLVSGGEMFNGDWLIADEDGIIVVKKDSIRQTLKAAEIKNKKERIYTEQLSEKKLPELMNLKNFIEGDGDLVIGF